jgi:uncharacterized protein (DUF2236 family)
MGYPRTGISQLVDNLFDLWRDRVVASTTGLFSHAQFPLAHTLEYRGDPGLFGPNSVTWPVLGDTAAFVGGIRALLVQAAHPEVMAGVADHSRYREDPLGRLSRTAAYVTATAFGARPEVERAVEMVRGAHRPVRGISHRDRAYSAAKPELAAWVHNALTDSFLTAYRTFGPNRLTEAQADEFVIEQTAVGRLLGAEPLPRRAHDLSRWLEHHPEVGRSPGLSGAVDFLGTPPLPWHVLVAYRVLFEAAVATIGPRLRAVLGLQARPGAIAAGRVAIASLRWSLGASPSWNLALVRIGAPIPAGRFRQPLPEAAVA